MKKKIISLFAAAVLAAGFTAAHAAEPVQMEYLDRGTVAVSTNSGVYVSWRLLGTEEYDTGFDVYRNGEKIATVSDSTNYTDALGKADDTYTVVPEGEPVANSVSFSGKHVTGYAVEDGLTVYAAAYDGDVLQKVHAEKVSGEFAFDTDFDVDRVFLWNDMNPAENNAVKSVSAWAQSYIDIPITLPAAETIKTPDGETVGTFSFSVSDCSTADLDGDGEYEIIAKMVSSEHDVGSPGDGINSFSGTVRFAAYKLDGTRLWANDINLGKNVYSSAHTVQFLAYDFDLDGKAELICQTSLGSMDAARNYVSRSAKSDPAIAAYTDGENASADFRPSWGPIHSGEEFLTIFDGETGKAIDTIALPTARIGNGESFGDDSGNRSNRFLASVAYLDGERPYAVYERGYYFRKSGGSGERMSACGVSFDGEKLSADYRFDTLRGQPGYYNGAEIYVGNGNHNCTVADVDGDGRDEFITGALCLEVDDDNQFKAKWCTFMEHGDALHMGDYDPTHPGLELFVVHEDGGPNTMSGETVEINYGMSVIDAANGEIIFHQDSSSDNGRGIMANIGAGGYYQITSANAGTFRSNGGSSFDSASYSGMSMNFRVFWDGDLYDELLDGTSITSWSGRRMSSIFNASNYNCVKVNGTKSNPSLQADILGDWREEVIYPTADGTALRVFTTTTKTDNKLYTLMHDRAYRMQVSSEQTAYNQPPHIGYYVSNDHDMYDAREYAAYIKTVHNGVTAQRTTNTEMQDTTVNIKINFLDEEGNEIKPSETLLSIIGIDYSAPERYLEDFGMDEDGMCWRYVSGNGVNTGQTAGATVELNLVFRRIEKYIQYSVNAVDEAGNVIKTLCSGRAETDSGTVTRYGDYGIVGDNGRFYVLADTSANFVTFTPTAEDKIREIKYTEVYGNGEEFTFESYANGIEGNSRMIVATAPTKSNPDILTEEINGNAAACIIAGAADDRNGLNNLAIAQMDLEQYIGDNSKAAVSYDILIENSGRMLVSLLNTDLESQWDSGWFQVARTRPSGSSEGFYINGENKNDYVGKWIRATFDIDLETHKISWIFTDCETGRPITFRAYSKTTTFDTLKTLTFVSWTENATAYLDNVSIVAYGEQIEATPTPEPVATQTPEPPAVTTPNPDYEVSNDGTLTAYKGSDDIVTVPSEIDGVTVTSIGELAFFGNDMIRIVRLPETVTEVQDMAFHGCGNLSSIEFGNVKTIGDSAFSDCSSLSEINFDSVETIGDEAFIGCGIRNLDLRNVTQLGASAFTYCSKLYSAWLSENLAELKAGTFGDCTSLRFVYMLNPEMIIDNTAFGGVNMESLTIWGYRDSTAMDFADNNGCRFWALD